MAFRFRVSPGHSYVINIAKKKEIKTDIDFYSFGMDGFLINPLLVAAVDANRRFGVCSSGKSAQVGLIRPIRHICSLWMWRWRVCGHRHRFDCCCCISPAQSNGIRAICASPVHR